MVMKQKKPKPVRTPVRMPESIYVQAVEASEASNRSLNNFIVLAIQEKLKRGDWLDDQISRAEK